MGIIFKNVVDLVNEFYGGILGAVFRSEAILAIKKQMICCEVVIKLVVDHSLKNFRDDVKQWYWPVISKLSRFTLIFKNWDYFRYFQTTGEYTAVERLVNGNGEYRRDDIRYSFEDYWWNPVGTRTFFGGEVSY